MSVTNPNPQTARSRKPSGGTFYNLQLVIIVAFVIATLFTAWTPASLIPGNLSEQLSQVMAVKATTIVDFPTPTARSRPLIGIVVGHWDDITKDPGAVCQDGLTEFQINQDIATRVQQNLRSEGFDVDLLREFDDRLNDYQALALVSIHADSCDYINDDATGFKVAATLANPYPERSARLTACLRDRYAEATGMEFHANTVTQDMSGYHAFDEINSETNAVIIEVGFLNLDRQMLTKKQGRVAEGITNGILCYVRNEDINQDN